MFYNNSILFYSVLFYNSVNFTIAFLLNSWNEVAGTASMLNKIEKIRRLEYMFQD